MYKCPECGAIFEELYGVGSMFPDRHYGTFANCPHCGGSIDIEYDTWDEEYDDENDE